MQNIRHAELVSASYLQPLEKIKTLKQVQGDGNVGNGWLNDEPSLALFAHSVRGDALCPKGHMT